MDLQSSSIVPTVDAVLKDASGSVQYKFGYASGSKGRRVEIVKSYGKQATPEAIAVIEFHSFGRDTVTLNGKAVTLKKEGLRNRSTCLTDSLSQRSSLTIQANQICGFEWADVRVVKTRGEHWALGKEGARQERTSPDIT